MGEVLVSLVPYVVASAVVPLQVVLGILLLRSPDRGLIKAVAYVAGMTTTRVLQGLIFGFVLLESAASTERTGGRSLVVSTLLLVLGIFLLTTAYRQWKKEVDPDDPPPKWLTMMDSMTPLKAYGVGVALPLTGPNLWVFTLSALGTIATARLGIATSTVIYVIYLVLSQSLLLLPILVCLIAPKRSRAALDGTSDWLVTNNRSIVIVASLVFGSLFLYRGIGGLLS